MLFWLALCLLCSTAWSQYQLDRYSYSPPVGIGNGDRYATSGTGCITAIRMWELNNNILTGFQLKYGFAWTPLVGHNATNRVDMTLFEGEAIVQVSGKYNPSNYIYELVFVTSRGRFQSAGQPTGLSFSHYPTHPESELRILSGRANGQGITSLGAHWATVNHMGNDDGMHDNKSTSLLN
ncbi:hypothetical protein ACEWY4_024022 [Coilia grayii]|uniref:Jacalin-type lectin domain-containing protein n=1 Tax=Coilia grayii TaxID=363190 RepID=A0ABD1J041_9TELE